MDNPFPTMLICIGYIWLVKYVGPWFMANRPPYDIKKIVVLYNAAQVLFSLWLFYEV